MERQILHRQGKELISAIGEQEAVKEQQDRNEQSKSLGKLNICLFCTLIC